MLKNKAYGQIFTPKSIVNTMLDYCGYIGDSILEKHIMDNSCGNGAFLTEIVNRYCKVFRGSLSELKAHLEKYVHGIEIDKKIYEQCIANLDRTVNKYGVSDVKWDILNADALDISSYNNKMDFVVGNPPYVRVHNLNDYNKAKTFNFAAQGMIDLYIIFFEIGFNMLNRDGKMCLITPSSWLSSKAGLPLRQYIQKTKNLMGIIDLEHYQPFDASTYTVISLFQKGLSDCGVVSYSTLNENGMTFIDNLAWKDIVFNRDFCFSNKKQLHFLRQIKNCVSMARVQVKNGFATLADSVFIGDFSFDTCCINIIKASTGKWRKCIYPYDKSGKPLTFKELQQDTGLADYLTSRYNNLINRSIDSVEDGWYLFGRTQGINDVHKNKIAVNTLVKDLDSLKVNIVNAGAGVYSGLYILSDIDFETIRQSLCCEEFLDYIRALKKYKSGGYYTFSSKDLEIYLNYKLGDEHDGQLRFL